MKILKKQSKRQTQLYEITTLVAGGLSLHEVLDKLARIATEITGAKACSIRLLNDETNRLEMRSTFGLSDEYRNKGPVTKYDSVIKAAFEGEAVVVDDMRIDKRVRYPQAAAREGLVSQLTVAMSFKDKKIGALRIYSPKARRFGEEDVLLARAIASQCAVAITNARLYAKAIAGAEINQQMRLAGTIQRRMIPQQAPRIAGLEVSAIYKPCFGIGGDLYDFVKLDDNRLVVAIADVIGKGIPAALMMSSFRGMLRAYSVGGHKRHTMDEVVSRLNKVACRECRGGEFISLFYAIIDVRDMTVTYCNCGHEPALLLRQGRVSQLQKGGLVLGIKDDSEYEVETVPLENNDRLLLYTDGLIDAVNFESKLWGLDNLLETVKKCGTDSVHYMVRDILRYRRRFIGLAQQTDDTSLVAVRINKDLGS